MKGCGTLLGKRLRLDSLSEGDNNELIESEVDYDAIGQLRLDYQYVKSNSQKSRISS